MIAPNRTPVSVFLIALATLIAGSSVRAQSDPPPLVFAAQAQSVQQQINVLKAQVASLQATDSSLKNKVGSLQATNTMLQGEINSLKSSNASFQSQVKNLQTANANLQSEVGGLKTGHGALQTQLAGLRSNPVFALGPFVSVDPNPQVGVVGPNITFKGANLHIVSGSGSTYEGSNPSGLGNLIIGYDEDPLQSGFYPPPDGTDLLPLHPGDRGGSHNLVIGRYNRFTKTAFGGFVAGELNTISNEATSVTGGYHNTASGPVSSVTGGEGNVASGGGASVTGGGSNTASGDDGSVTGGEYNQASGGEASVTGGVDNNANGRETVVTGGSENTAVGLDSVVLGGSQALTSTDHSIRPQPPFPN